MLNAKNAGILGMNSRKRTKSKADPLIANAGLFWKADEVDWGGRGKGNEGSLVGVASNRKTGPEIDFRDQSGIYVLYSNFRIVYVGQTGSRKHQKLLRRLKQHRKDHTAERWDRFSWFGLKGVRKNGKLRMKKTKAHPTLPTILNHIEGILIYSAEPPLNRQSGRFGKGVTFYLQSSGKNGSENQT